MSSCGVFDYRNPGVPSIESENFLTTNCLPPYLQFSAYIIMIILQGLVALYSLYIVIRSFFAFGFTFRKPTAMALCSLMGGLVRFSTFICLLFSYDGVYRFISIGGAIAFDFFAASIAVYQWLSATMIVKHFHNFSDEIFHSLSKLRNSFLVLNIVIAIGNVLTWGVAGHYRKTDPDKFNWLALGAYMWFGLFNCASFGLISFVSVSRFQKILQEEMSDVVMKKLQRVKYLSYALLFLSMNGLGICLTMLIWFLSTMHGPLMHYFFGVLFLVFLPTELCCQLLFSMLANLQIGARLASTQPRSTSEDKSQPLKPIV